MKMEQNLEIFLVSIPGLETLLLEEVREKGFKKAKRINGGVTITGNWRDVWRANLYLRGASRVLVRIGSFRVLHLAQLDKRARKFPWGEVLRSDVPVRVNVSCKRSRIYHEGAATQRIARAIEEELEAPISSEAEICVKVRIEDDLCTISVDSSGEGLHKRDHKLAVNKAPMRETIAALLLRQCGYKGDEPVVDPMCGSGTFVIEAAEIAAGLYPGRTRHFAFENFINFDPLEWEKLCADVNVKTPAVRFYGSDRDAGAIQMSLANAERSGVQDFVEFSQHVISDLHAPEGPVGLVIVNPPYGERIGDIKPLYPLYHSLGQCLMAEFSGWRVGLVTSSDALAKASGLAFRSISQPISHGGLKVKLYISDPLV
jgi:putative N6-adenine-specific DNA methylase